MDYSDTDSDSSLGYSDDEDSSDEVQRISESVHRKYFCYLKIFLDIFRALWFHWKQFLTLPKMLKRIVLNCIALILIINQ